jgi:hypothetical protein
MWIHGPVKSVHGYHMRALGVPSTVFPPVCDRDVGPGVVEGAGVLEDSHCVLSMRETTTAMKVVVYFSECVVCFVSECVV